MAGLGIYGNIHCHIQICRLIDIGMTYPGSRPQSPPNPQKRISGKQRKATLEEYQQTFLQVPRIDDRKPVFVSSDVRDRQDRVVRILGGRRMSVSGIIENIVRHHLSLYEEDFEAWRKL